MIKKRYVNHGIEYYPTPEAHEGGKRLGVSPWRKCVQCGMPNDTRKTGWAEVEASGNDNDGGCRFCHSLRWQWSKPTALPDDRFLPAEKVRKRR